MENNLKCECTMVQYFCLGHAQILTDTVAERTQKFFNCLLYKTYNSAFRTANTKRQYKKRKKVLPCIIPYFGAIILCRTLNTRKKDNNRSISNILNHLQEKKESLMLTFLLNMEVIHYVLLMYCLISKHIHFACLCICVCEHYF